ncbi:cytidine deaminase [bacterium]|nr:cytidine deaminase [bacterium]
MKNQSALKVVCELLIKDQSELSNELNNLCNKAIEASQTANAPFSKFKVGAAALLSDQTVVIGSNQENVAYPSGLCAERVALFACGAQHHNKVVKALAVYVDSFENLEEIPMPCGGCRQVMNQTESDQKTDLQVLLVTKNKKVYIARNTEMLLPFPFRF